MNLDSLEVFVHLSHSKKYLLLVKKLHIFLQFEFVDGDVS